MSQSIAILGCGPSGLMAAHAAVLRGQTVSIFSRKIKSEIGGAQYLHRQIPGITGEEPDGYIHVIKRGTPEGYAEKVYGDGKRSTSWHDHRQGAQVPAWDLRKAYDKLWEMYAPRALDVEIDSDWVGFLLKNYKAVISTVPAPVVCEDSGHEFARQEITIDLRCLDISDNTMIYNGVRSFPWYRASRIFGVVGGYEYPGDIAAQYRQFGARMVTARKPLSTTCTCWPNLFKAGRYGVWDKSLLTHDSFQAVWEAME